MNLQLVLPVYFKFVKKWKYLLRKKTNKQKKKKTKKKKEKEKKISDGQSRTLDHQRDKWTRYLLRHNS